MMRDENKRFQSRIGTMQSLKTAILVLTAFLHSASCSSEGSLEPNNPSAEHLSYPDKAVVHWQSIASWSEETIRQAAEASIMIIPIERCFSPESTPIIERIKQLNPEMKIIGYRTLLSVDILYPDTTYLRNNLPYVLDYYEAVRGNWGWTTENDTIFIWPGQIMLDPIDSGSLDTDLIDRMVNLIAEYRQSYGNLDGIMHDYFMYDAYLNPYARETMIGDVDFDEDGIRHEDDADEKALFYEWQKEYVRAIRSRFGSDFIEIGNGRPPQEDAELAGLLNGIFYELYPNNPWGKTDRDGLLRLLENQREGYLLPALGRTWSLCTNEKGNLHGNNYFCMLSSLLADCMYTELSNSYVFRGWTLDISTGPPRSAALVEGRMDSILTVRRNFELGEVRISFESSGRRIETIFESFVE